MSDTLFLITGGGTGAKVAEAFVHLCAAGLGPKQAHILFVDADATNGNLQRALATAQAYEELQTWPWSVNASYGGLLGVGKKRASLTLFRTKITVSQITEPVETTRDGARTLKAATAADPDLGRVLDLLYDADEQEAKNDDGFRARPNLGCLLLSEHLQQKVRAGRAHVFFEALQGAAEGGGSVPVVVTASVFGGTGASLLPVARGVVENVLRESGQKKVIGQLRWAAAMVLPHYLPSKRVESVDPDRYLLDTAGALQFYGTMQRSAASAAGMSGAADGPAAGAVEAPNWAFHAVYTIGSDRPERNSVRPSLGREDQANPAYLEEAIAALAALDFGRRPDGGRPVRSFHPASETVGWTDLPLGADGELRRHMAYLLHLAAFYLRPARSRPAHEQGLAATLRSADSDPDRLLAEQWFSGILHPWAESLSTAYKGTDRRRQPQAIRDAGVLPAVNAAGTLLPAAAGYFARLLLWAATALRSSDPERPELTLVDFAADTDGYRRLFAAMANRSSADLNADADGATLDPASDNALVRALRTALAAFVADHAASGGSVIKAKVIPLFEDDGRIRVRMAVSEIGEGLSDERMGDIAATFTKTAPAAS